MKFRNSVFPSFPDTAPLAYSAILRMTSEAFSFHWTLIAFCRQEVMQRPQPTQAFGSICAFPSRIAIAAWAQDFRQTAQPVQNFAATLGATVECCCILPVRLEHPMPRFFRVPPKPVSSWHLKWETATSASASRISAPMLTVCRISPSTRTSCAVCPRRPSSMTRGAPTTAKAKPFSMAQESAETASLRSPGYRVEESVRNGLAPHPLISSTTRRTKIGRTKVWFPFSPKCTLTATRSPGARRSASPASLISRPILSKRFSRAPARISAKNTLLFI